MWTTIFRAVTVGAVLGFAAMAMGVRPSPGGTEPAGSAGDDAAEDERGLVRIVEPADAKASADLAVEQLAALGSRAGVTRAEPFLIVSDADTAWTQNRAALLQRAAHQFKRFADRLGYRVEPSDEPLVVVLINDHERYARFAQRHDAVEAGWVAGYYASLSNRVVFYNDATGPSAAQAGAKLREYDELVARAKEMASDARRERRGDDAATLEKRASEMAARLKHEKQRVTSATRINGQAKAVHEAVHLLAFNWGLQARDREYPFWLTEGLATNFETEKPGNAFGPEHEFDPRRRDFDRVREGGRLIPLEVFVQMMTVPGDDEETADVMYAQSWSLFRYLFRYEREALCEYFRDIKRQPPGRMGPKRHLEIFRARFGDVESLERAWLKRA